MQDVLAGIRVVEVASWTFVPSSGAILAEWGADVIKIEDPERGDPQRGLISSGLIPPGGANFMYEIPNRGKRSVGLNIAVENNTIVKISGPNKELVGQVAAELRQIRPPEPYKGKGIRYQGERVRRKAGKTGAK